MNGSDHFSTLSEINGADKLGLTTERAPHTLFIASEMATTAPTLSRATGAPTFIIDADIQFVLSLLRKTDGKMLRMGSCLGADEVDAEGNLYFDKEVEGPIGTDRGFLLPGLQWMATIHTNYAGLGAGGEVLWTMSRTCVELLSINIGNAPHVPWIDTVEQMLQLFQDPAFADKWV